MRVLTGLLFLACTAACSGAQPAGSVERAAGVAAMLQGKFDNADQAQAEVNHRAVLMTVVPVLAGRNDGHWLYVERAMSLKPDKPFAQQVYRLHDGEGDEVLAEVYSIDKPYRFAQGWASGALAQLQRESLQPLAGCTLQLRAEGAAWRGTTEGKDCKSDRGGASYAITEITVDARGVRAWERGYDAAGKEVWGAKSPYAFIKRADAP